MNISSIFGNKKQIKSFAEQLAEVKNIFKTSYDLGYGSKMQL